MSYATLLVQVVHPFSNLNDNLILALYATILLSSIRTSSFSISATRISRSVLDATANAFLTASSQLFSEEPTSSMILYKDSAIDVISRGVHALHSNHEPLFKSRERMILQGSGGNIKLILTKRFAIPFSRYYTASYPRNSAELNK